MIKTIYAIAAIACLAACHKSNEDANPPVITLTSPTDHQLFNAGQVVTINATVKDDDEIHEAHLYVTNKSTGAELVHMEEHPDSKMYSFNQTFTAAAGTSYKIRIEANDHAMHQSEIEVEVSGR